MENIFYSSFFMCKAYYVHVLQGGVLRMDDLRNVQVDFQIQLINSCVMLQFVWLVKFNVNCRITKHSPNSTTNQDVHQELPAN
jgi:hypothetical protein